MFVALAKVSKARTPFLFLEAPLLFDSLLTFLCIVRRLSRGNETESEVPVVVVVPFRYMVIRG